MDREINELRVAFTAIIEGFTNVLHIIIQHASNLAVLVVLYTYWVRGMLSLSAYASYKYSLERSVLAVRFQQPFHTLDNYF